MVSNDPIKLSEDGGVIKYILEEGVGDESPPQNSTVTVHYTGRLLDGAQFDSSVGRGPFEFKLGTGQVIKGWDIGVASMKKGEKCILECKPDYAYGAQGSPPKIPANSTLKFEVELLSWNDLEKLSDGLFKKVLVEADRPSFQTPISRSVVKVSYKGMLECGRVFINIEDPVEFMLSDDPSIPEGLEKGIESMKSGEKAKFVMDPSLGFGELGLEESGVPSNAKLTYEVTLHSFEKGKDTWELSSSEKIAEANRLKGIANRLYASRRWDRAVSMYTSGMEAVRYIDGEEKEAAQQINLVLASNSAAAHLKKCDYEQALESCNEALAIDGSHVKSLLRRAQAYNAKAEYALCRADLDAALRTEPENKSALSLLKVVKAKLKQIQKKERKTFSGIFEKLSALNEKEEGVKNAASPVIGSAKETVTQGSGDTQDPIAPSPWDREA